MEPVSLSCNLTGHLCIKRSSPYEYLLTVDTEIIETIQYHYKIIEEFIGVIDIISSHMFTYIYVFPLIYLIAPGMGLQVLWASLVADFITYIMKYITNTHRPYWYIVDAPAVYNVSLIQYPGTCQFLSGMPSSRITVTTACWYSIFYLLRRHLTACEERGLKIMVIILLGLCGLARVFYATNFIHQVILSYVIGRHVAKSLCSFPMYNMCPFTYFNMAVFIMITSQICVYLLSNIGLSQEWTICKAYNACLDLDRLPKNRIFPFEPFIRSMFLFFGTGTSLVLHSTVYNKHVYVKHGVARKILSYITIQFVILSIQCLVYPNLNLSSTKHSPFNYYMGLCLYYFFIPLTVISIVPRATRLYCILTTCESCDEDPCSCVG